MNTFLLAVIVTLTNNFGLVSVDTFGARIVSYIPRGGVEVISTRQSNGELLKGLSRNRNFKIVRTRDNSDTSSIELEWGSDAASRLEYPYDCQIQVIYRLGRTLSATMKIRNTGCVPIPVCAAFQSFIKVKKAESCQLEGVGELSRVTSEEKIYKFATNRRTYSLIDAECGHRFEFVSTGDTEVKINGEADWVAVANGRISKESEVTVQPGMYYTLLRTIRDVSAFPYGANETEFWQSRIDSMSANGGGKLVIPAGEHTVAQLKLKSGVTLHLEKGARLAAATDYADHPAIPNEDRGAIIWAEDAENIGIEGLGEIDGRGGDMPIIGHYPGRWRGIQFLRCRNVLIQDVSLKNAHSWFCYLRECDGVVVRRIKLFNRMNHNNDGLDIASKNVLVEDCDINTEDDGIVLKNHNPDFVVENVKVRNCRVSSGTSFLKIGTETWGGFRNIDIRDCVCDLKDPMRVRDSRRNVPNSGCETLWSGSDGIALEIVDGGFMENVTVSNIVMKRGIFIPLFIRLDNRGGHANGRNSFMRNILVENVKMELPEVSWFPCSITGASGLRPSNIQIKDCDFKMRACRVSDKWKSIPVPERAGSYPSGSMFQVITPAFGAYINNADNVKLDNVHFELVGGEDSRSSVVGL